MKLIIKSYTYTSLVNSILFLILGTILMTNADSIIKFISYILGGMLIIISLIKFLGYKKDKKAEEEYTGDLVYALFLLIGGIACFFLGNVLETLIRFLIGGWILFIGINRLIGFFSIQNKNHNTYALLSISLLLIIIGFIIILFSSIILKWLGILMIAYAVLDILGYLFYTHNEIKKENISNK